MKRQTISVEAELGYSGILVLVLLGAVLLPMTGCGQVQAAEAPVDEEIYLTPYEPGSLIYHVDRYIEEELSLAKQIAEESFEETLQNTIDWNSNYYKLVISDAEPRTALPSSLKLIVHSRRYAKLIEHGKNGLTDKEKSSLTSRLSSDLARWRKLWSDGQRPRASSIALHRVDQSSEELIVPLTYRINAAVLLAEALSVEEALPSIIQCVDTLGEDTNWSAVGYACDKILGSLDTKTLNPEQQGIVEGYYAWKDGQDAKAFDYETQEFPSFKSPTRPFERATALGANSDVLQDKVCIELPTQYYYMLLPEGKGYFDMTGYYSDISYSDIQKKVVSFAKSYCETLESTDIMESAVSFVEGNLMVENEIARESRQEAEFQSKLRDPREFVKMRSDHEITPAIVKGLFDADSSLPVLYSLLDDPAYEDYWPRIVKTICFVSNTPKSAPVILEYVRRSDDWESLSGFGLSARCLGKIDSLRWIGLLGSEDANQSLMQMLTTDGVKDFAGEWLDGPLPLWAKTPQDDIIGVIQGSAAIGIAHSQNQQGIGIVKEMFEAERAKCKKQGYGTALCAMLAEAMAINSIIESKGIDEYWNLLSDDVRYISTLELQIEIVTEKNRGQSSIH